MLIESAMTLLWLLHLFLAKVDEPKQDEPIATRAETRATSSSAMRSFLQGLAGSHWDEDVDIAPQVQGGTLRCVHTEDPFSVHCH